MKEYRFAEGYKPRLPNGEYEAQCIRYDNKFVLGKTKKLFLHFKIIEQGEHNGKVIFMAFNMRYDDKIKQGSKYFKTWCMVNHWNLPSRNAKLSPRLFSNKIYKVKTRTVKPEHNKKQMPEPFWYSVVDEIVEVVAG
ncbi:hypothetical protein DSCA_60040 [Desulfosarcina alkanivorans]|uniref:DUF669 domain-containing protein n=1 Tax=Desulfosarcina alkanivorans TaxID=571177 RepID=A0A5K7Z0R3_9BACT|nr:hypothetical protein [Desulfosarcina alkanivorans]BBO72074.1 hypothetical protein DSCA_60040 [Desulfosarcina alkanivorans]